MSTFEDETKQNIKERIMTLISLSDVYSSCDIDLENGFICFEITDSIKSDMKFIKKMYDCFNENMEQTLIENVNDEQLIKDRWNTKDTEQTQVDDLEEKTLINDINKIHINSCPKGYMLIQNYPPKYVKIIDEKEIPTFTATFNDKYNHYVDPSF